MSQIVVTREGSGPELLLVHGGASPERTLGGAGPAGGTLDVGARLPARLPASPARERAVGIDESGAVGFPHSMLAMRKEKPRSESTT